MAKFTPEEQFCIRQMVKKGYQTRTIAQMLERDVLDLHHFIKDLVKAEPSAAPPRREPRTIPHYDDPRSAEVGSRMLLEAVNKYLQKRAA
jgi:hypothetical protein